MTQCGFQGAHPDWLGKQSEQSFRLHYEASTARSAGSVSSAPSQNVTTLGARRPSEPEGVPMYQRVAFISLPAIAFFFSLSNVLPAAAQTATTQFNVQMTIVGECKINSAANLNFGSVGIIGSNLDATSNLVVQCTNGTSYTLGLDNGTGSGATSALRKMTGPNSETIGYALYSDAARSSVWGSTVGTNTKTGVGNGNAQTFTIYGRVAPQTTPAAGSYADTVTVTLTY